jgi:hypothetical protein
MESVRTFSSSRKDFGSAIALMDVEIDYGGAELRISFLQENDGYRDVVEDAIAGAFGAEGVMRASG